MGQIDMGGGHSGDVPEEDPQRQHIAWESEEEEEHVDSGEKEHCSSCMAEGESGG